MEHNRLELCKRQEKTPRFVAGFAKILNKLNSGESRYGGLDFAARLIESIFQCDSHQPNLKHANRNQDLRDHSQRNCWDSN